MHALGHRGILRRQPERIPAHRMQHGEALRPLVARDHVAQRVVAHVAHVDPAGRIGKHLEHVVLGSTGSSRAANVPCSSQVRHLASVSWNG